MTEPKNPPSEIRGLCASIVVVDELEPLKRPPARELMIGGIGRPAWQAGVVAAIAAHVAAAQILAAPPPLPADPRELNRRALEARNLARGLLDAGDRRGRDGRLQDPQTRQARRAAARAAAKARG